MSNILVNTIKDTGNNTLLSSDGSGSVTLGSGFPQNTPAFLAYRFFKSKFDRFYYY
jgi:hypothetical protein